VNGLRYRSRPRRGALVVPAVLLAGSVVMGTLFDPPANDLALVVATLLAGFFVLWPVGLMVARGRARRATERPPR
jgi:hypothetical protein